MIVSKPEGRLCKITFITRPDGSQGLLCPDCGKTNQDMTSYEFYMKCWDEEKKDG